MALVRGGILILGAMSRVTYGMMILDAGQWRAIACSSGQAKRPRLEKEERL